MLEVMMEGRVPYVLMGILTVIGIWSKKQSSADAAGEGKV